VVTRDFGAFDTLYLASQEMHSNINAIFQVIWRWDEDAGKIYLENYGSEGTVIVVIAINATRYEQIRKSRARSWAYDWALAQTKITIGRVRSKFSSGAISFTTDGEALIAEGKLEQDTLDESKKNLDATFAVER